MVQCSRCEFDSPGRNHLRMADFPQDNLTPSTESSEPKKVSSKVSKAQRRAQQAEFNRQLWAEAYEDLNSLPTSNIY